jgi:hypothetical protein
MFVFGCRVWYCGVYGDVLQLVSTWWRASVVVLLALLLGIVPSDIVVVGFSYEAASVESSGADFCCPSVHNMAFDWRRKTLIPNQGRWFPCQQTNST